MLRRVAARCNNLGHWLTNIAASKVQSNTCNAITYNIQLFFPLDKILLKFSNAVWKGQLPEGLLNPTAKSCELWLSLLPSKLVTCHWIFKIFQRINCCSMMLMAWAVFVVEKVLILAGLEPAIPWFVVRCLIHWATRPSLVKTLFVLVFFWTSCNPV